MSSDKQNEINKTAAPERSHAPRRICGVLGYVILFYVFAISYTRKYFRRVNPFVSHQLFVKAERGAGEKNIVRETIFNLNFGKCDVFDSSI